MSGDNDLTRSLRDVSGDLLHPALICTAAEAYGAPYGGFLNAIQIQSGTDAICDAMRKPQSQSLQLQRGR